MDEGRTYNIQNKYIYMSIFFFIFMIQIKIARREIQLPLYRIHFEIAKFFAKIQDFSPYKYFVFFIKIMSDLIHLFFRKKDRTFSR